MPIIKTKRNYVAALDPLPQDRFVQTWLTGDERRLLMIQPIEKYREAVDWALSRADHMSWPIEVIPVENGPP